MDKNKGFSLVELIIVIAIIAILIAVIAPAFTQYVVKAKRTADARNAESFIECARIILAEHQLDTKYDGVHYSAAVAWNKDSKFDKENPQTLLDYFAKELGVLPVSKAHPDYFYTLRYDQEAYPISLHIGPTPGSTQYELWPNPSDYIAGK